MERFIKEYANYKKKNLINENKLYGTDINENLSKIERTLKVRDRDLITIDETMKILATIY